MKKDGEEISEKNVILFHIDKLVEDKYINVNLHFT